jgi:ankyrin repeat protein
LVKKIITKFEIKEGFGDLLSIASEQGNLEMIEFLAEKEPGNYPLLWACIKNNPILVDYLISKGADVNTYNGVALKWAFRRGYENIVKSLMDNGAELPGMGTPIVSEPENNLYKPRIVAPPSAPPPEYTAV